MDRIILIFGPTACSKSRIAINVATRFGCEIINADSRQFFKYMKIGTASPTDEDTKKVPHHLYNILEPDETINAGRFKNFADVKIQQIISRGKIPILVGGTGLYIRVLKGGIARIPEIPSEIRLRVKHQIETDGLKKCYEYLEKIDKEYASIIKSNDRHRIERAIEVYLTTGFPFSSYHKEHNFKKSCYRTISINILPPKSLIDKRITIRTREIYKNGILEEARFLMENGYTSAHSFNAIGYREAISYLKGEIDLNKAIEATEIRTRQYAKRQITWFKREEGRTFTDPEKEDDIFEFINKELLNVQN